MANDDPDGSNRAQAEQLLSEPGSIEYALRPDDLEACKAILQSTLFDDTLTGGYTIMSMQAYHGSVTVHIAYDKHPGPEACAQVAEHLIDASPKLGQLAKKVIAHMESRGAKLEKFLAAHDAVEDGRIDGQCNYISQDDYNELVLRLRAAREALQ